MIEVLTLAQYYLPGYTAGGPIRTIANFAEKLGEDLRIKIITSQFDPRDPKPYRDVRPDEYTNVGNAQVYYASSKSLKKSGLRDIICATSHDVLYLNSFFAPTFSIKPMLLRRLGQIPDRPMVIAPRGEFSQGAIAIKPLKKQLFVAVAKAAKLCESVIWAATSEYEKQDIQRQFGKNVDIQILPNLSGSELPSVTQQQLSKKDTVLRIVFVSRIARKKNLDGALRILQGVREMNIEFDIYGPQEDEIYWRECEELINELPTCVKACYKGAVKHEQVSSILANYDVFFFPTHGENYGHVILEALSAACPVIISDQTPWRDLEKKQIGWDIPLDEVDKFRAALAQCYEMNTSVYKTWAQNAYLFAQSVVDDSRLVGQNLRVFEYASGGNKSLKTT